MDTTRGAKAHYHYVAFSSVTDLKGLHHLNGFNGKISVDKSVGNEMHRLRAEATLRYSFKKVE